MLIDKDYNPFKHLHSRLDIIETQIGEVRKRLELPEKELRLTRKMLCERYHVSNSTITRHIKLGELKYFKVGSKTLFHLKDVEKWIRQIQ